MGCGGSVVREPIANQRDEEQSSSSSGHVGSERRWSAYCDAQSSVLHQSEDDEASASEDGDEQGGQEANDAAFVAEGDELGMGSSDTFECSASGVIWEAHVYADDYQNPKHCTPSGALKPRRPLPQVRASDFFGSLMQSRDGRWIFDKPLNDWPGLVGLELRKVATRSKSRFKHWSKQLWDADKTSAAPVFPPGKHSVRVTLRGPSWTSMGWSATSPGFVFWCAMQDGGGVRLFYGEDMTRALREKHFTTIREVTPDTLAVRCHYFAHRYAKASESMKDKMIYHTAVLVEWNHGLFTTIFELGFWNGLTGYGGKSNWFTDKDGECPILAQAVPECMKAPWRTGLAELRVTDHPAKSVDEFEAYLKEYDSRFLLPEIVSSAQVRLCHRNQEDMMRYALNYIGRDWRYAEGFRNCQTFTADFFGFLAGKKGVEPYVKVCRVGYTPRPYLFLYELDSYTRK